MFKTELKRCMALTLATAFLLSGCTRETPSPASNADIYLPEPEARSARTIAGEQYETGTYDVTLHYASENALSLSTVSRTLQPEKNESLIERTLEALLDSAALSGAVEASIDQLEISSDIVTVNLNLDAGANRSEQDYLLLCASIASTLLQFESVEAVNILAGNRSNSICALPMGAFVDAQDNIAALYAQLQSESEHLSSEGGSISRNALLYFPAQDGRYILSEVRELNFEGTDYASELMRALSDGPLMRSCSDSPLPGNLDFLEKTPTQLITSTGERIIELYFSSALVNYLDFTGMELWQFYASIVLSFCSFIPELDAVRFYIDQEPVEECAFRDRNLHFEDALMHRADFSSAVGSSANLYFASGESGLARIEIPMARHACASPLALLKNLLSTQPRPDLNVRSAFPEGISENDILGVYVDGNTATVSLSANFYARCQSLTAQEERQLIYAMVNTLTELSQIDAVAFLVEGNVIDCLAQEIYLGVALLPDLGLTRSGAPSLLSED